MGEASCLKDSLVLLTLCVTAALLIPTHAQQEEPRQVMYLIRIISDYYFF